MSGTPAPYQSAAALDKANMVRTARTQDKARIGGLAKPEALGVVAEILCEMPVQWARATAFELLKCVPYVGRWQILRWLHQAGVQEGRHLRELTERQRFALAGLLRANDGARVAA